MKTNIAIKTLSALAHDGRLALMRRLIQAGPDGIGAGDLARMVNIGPTTASAQLLVLSNAGLVQSRKEGRRVTYVAEFSQFRDLMSYLLHDCCAGRTEICCGIEKAAP